jgi:LysR family transcriptional regulator, low CO2-responsive transcriptional regulator
VVTPTQLRAFVAVVRCGSVKGAGEELGVSAAAISLHVAELRKTLGDQLFERTSAGLAFTPGGLRLASRAAEMLGLQDRTILEVKGAGSGRRLLRVAASNLFAEHAAPGLIELFTSRANDLDVELSVYPPSQLSTLLLTRSADVAFGPVPPDVDPALVCTSFLKFQVIVVVGPAHPLAQGRASHDELRAHTWLLGPAAADDEGVIPEMLRRLRVPEDRQRIFQSDSAALEEARRNKGVGLAVSFVVSQDVAKGRLVKLSGPGLLTDAVWSTLSLRENSPTSPVAELTRFVTTPRATQAMLRGSGVNVSRFKPSVHITLWS